jgi:hypothetical protein
MLAMMDGKDLDACYAAILAGSRAGWQAAASAWLRDGLDDPADGYGLDTPGMPPGRFWLLGAAAYLFRTGNTRWAMDLSFKNAAIREAVTPGLVQDLSALRFMLVTHAHGDHFDHATVNLLADLPITWIMPRFMLDNAVHNTSIPAERIIGIAAGERIMLDGIAIEAFTGLHWDESRSEGIDALGYLVDTGTRRLLFPGDVRVHDAAALPDHGRIDALFAHVWLGRDAACEPCPERYLGCFTDFVTAVAPRCVFLTHLYETDRQATAVWTYRHAGMIMDRLAACAPGITVVIPQRWHGYSLSE